MDVIEGMELAFLLQRIVEEALPFLTGGCNDAILFE